MVPAAGIAATADQAIADDGDFETLATSSADDNFSHGAISQVKVGNTTTTSLKNIKVVSNGANTEKVAPTVVTGANGAEININSTTAAGDPEFAVEYRNVSGTASYGPSADMPTAAGTYTVTVKGTGATGSLYTSAATLSMQFTVVSNALDGAFLFDRAAADSATDFSHTTFTYTGAPQGIGVAKDNADITSGCTINYYVQGTNAEVVDEHSASCAPTNAGSYYAVVAYNGAEAKYSFNVGQFDISTAKIVLADQEVSSNTTTTVQSINGNTALASSLSGDLELTYPGGVINETGTYEAKVALPSNATAAQKANVTGSQTASFNVVESTNVVFTYNQAPDDGTTVAAGNYDMNGTTENIDLADGESFNLSLIGAYTYTTGGTPDPDYTQITDSDYYTVTVTDEDGKVVDNASVNTPGTWFVRAAINTDSDAVDYALGGSAQMKVTTTKGLLANTDVYVSYDGSVKGSFTEEYDGSDMLSGVSVSVVAANNKKLVEGTDYEVVVTDGQGKKVDKMVDADNYTITVKGLAYSGSEIANFTISSIGVTPVAGNTITIDGTTGYGYTGSAVTPSVKYITSKKDSAGNFIYETLPSDMYTLTYRNSKGVSVDSCVATGDYTAFITLNDDVANYSLNATSFQFRIIDSKVFQDVPASAWFAGPVQKAHDNGYMNGYAGTDLFGPNDTLTRAQAVCVIFNMAGGAISDTTPGYSEVEGWQTGFDDVNGNMYYSRAIAWAHQLKIVNGVAGTNNFMPEADITREQFAAMLGNYAKQVGNYKAPEDVQASLDKVKDPGTVSDWAKESCAWAIDSKIMGNGGLIMAQANVTRAETAAMAVNYQPKPQTSAPEVTSSVAITSAAASFKSNALGKTENVAGLGTKTDQTMKITNDAQNLTLTVVLADANATVEEQGSNTTLVTKNGATVTFKATNAANGISFKVTNGNNVQPYTFTANPLSTDASLASSLTMKVTDNEKLDAPTSLTITPNPTIAVGNVITVNSLGTSLSTSRPIYVEADELNKDAESATTGATQLRTLTFAPTLPAGATLAVIGSAQAENSAHGVSAGIYDAKVSSDKKAIVISSPGKKAVANDTITVKFNVISAYGNSVEYTLKLMVH